MESVSSQRENFNGSRMHLFTWSSTPQFLVTVEWVLAEWVLAAIVVRIFGSHVFVADPVHLAAKQILLGVTMSHLALTTPFESTSSCFLKCLVI